MKKTAAERAGRRAHTHARAQAQRSADARTHANTHPHTRARARAHTHTHTPWRGRWRRPRRPCSSESPGRPRSGATPAPQLLMYGPKNLYSYICTVTAGNTRRPRSGATPAPAGPPRGLPYPSFRRIVCVCNIILHIILYNAIYIYIYIYI